jgi:hypothetical protein
MIDQAILDKYGFLRKRTLNPSYNQPGMGRFEMLPNPEKEEWDFKESLVILSTHFDVILQHKNGEVLYRGEVRDEEHFQQILKSMEEKCSAIRTAEEVAKKKDKFAKRPKK